MKPTVVVWLTHAPQPVFKLGDGDQRLVKAAGGEAAGSGQMLRDPDAHRRGSDDDRGVGIPVRIGFIEPRSAGRQNILDAGQPGGELGREDHPLGRLLGRRRGGHQRLRVPLVDGEGTEAVEPVKGVQTHRSYCGRLRVGPTRKKAVLIV